TPVVSSGLANTGRNSYRRGSTVVSRSTNPTGSTTPDPNVQNALCGTERWRVLSNAPGACFPTFVYSRYRSPPWNPGTPATVVFLPAGQYFAYQSSEASGFTEFKWMW